MTRLEVFALVVALAVGTFSLLPGCEKSGDQRLSMTSGSGEKQIICQACYDEVKAVRKQAGKGTRYEVVRKHMCSDCKVETALYTKGGIQMFKCAKCAPNGIACNQCMPPKARH